MKRNIFVELQQGLQAYAAHQAGKITLNTIKREIATPKTSAKTALKQPETAGVSITQKSQSA